MGHWGLSPDTSKVKEIQEMPQPDSKKSVEHFLGCLQYMAHFLPQLAQVAAPLHQLTEQSAIFTWQSQQEETFQLLKMITMAQILKFYNVTEEAAIQCDASGKGLGATLLQKGQPIAFPPDPSANLSKTMLAIVFTCERCNQYIHGRDYMAIHTDLRPLIPSLQSPYIMPQKTAKDALEATEIQPQSDVLSQQRDVHSRHAKLSIPERDKHK